MTDLTDLAASLPSHDAAVDADDCLSAKAAWDREAARLKQLIDTQTSELGVDLRWSEAMFADGILDAKAILDEKAEQLREFEHERAVDLRGYWKAVDRGVD